MIRRIEEVDFARLRDIWESSVSNTHHFLAEEDFEYYRENLPNYFPHVALFGYEIGNQLVGFVGVAAQNLEMLFIHNDFRRKGVGKALLDFSIQELNVKSVDVNEQNQQAIDFYLSQGFKVTSRSEKDNEGKAYPILHLSL
ncbi:MULTISPECIES: GNAT family N-acetyltransferase [Empedobacter]|uniref:GNAT family N-acetyltransferase n=1 Tax=Empedobacter falsenii TaxID=343874 RepID=A0A7H9DPR5_9FLAO|nr:MULTISPECIES: GNAT family N-acetyltransferase [Empedobacter]MDH2207778.1 GNAT family N-acetyltransferase [Empedobacter sp. GD03644]QLL57158.1 GNAT family N-acetyltransferase [Empedobacter falsenii]